MRPRGSRSNPSPEKPCTEWFHKTHQPPPIGDSQAKINRAISRAVLGGGDKLARRGGR